MKNSRRLEGMLELYSLNILGTCGAFGSIRVAELVAVKSQVTDVSN